MAKPITTAPTTMGRHGRIHEQEAEREKGVTFGTIPPRNPKDDPAPADSMGSVAARSRPITSGEPHPDKAEQEAQKNRQMHDAMERVAAQKPAAKPVEEVAVALVGPMLLADVEAALSDRYPHNDIRTMEGATIEVKVPTGVILVDFKAVNKCKNTAELRAYIDSLPVQ